MPLLTEGDLCSGEIYKHALLTEGGHIEDTYASYLGAEGKAQDQLLEKLYSRLRYAQGCFGDHFAIPINSAKPKLAPGEH